MVIRRLPQWRWPMDRWKTHCLPIQVHQRLEAPLRHAFFHVFVRPSMWLLPYFNTSNIFEHTIVFEYIAHLSTSSHFNIRDGLCKHMYGAKNYGAQGTFRGSGFKLSCQWIVFCCLLCLSLSLAALTVATGGSNTVPMSLRKTQKLFVYFYFLCSRILKQQSWHWSCKNFSAPEAFESRPQDRQDWTKKTQVLNVPWDSSHVILLYHICAFSLKISRTSLPWPFLENYVTGGKFGTRWQTLKRLGLNHGFGVHIRVHFPYQSCVAVH